MSPLQGQSVGFSGLVVNSKSKKRHRESRKTQTQLTKPTGNDWLNSKKGGRNLRHVPHEAGSSFSVIYMQVRPVKGKIEKIPACRGIFHQVGRILFSLITQLLLHKSCSACGPVQLSRPAYKDYRSFRVHRSSISNLMFATKCGL